MNWTNGRRAAATLAGSLLAALAIAAPVSAATYTVNTTDDGTTPSHCPPDVAPAGNACSLREAVRAANNTTVDDEIVVPAGRHELKPEFGTIFVDAAQDEEADAGKLLIRGAGARDSIVDANRGANSGIRAFTFRQNAVGELRDLSLTGGGGRICIAECFNPPGQDEADEDDFGGALAVFDTNGDGDNDGDVLLTRVRVFDSHAQRDGGAIFNKGKLRIVQSLIDGNKAKESGGGIENDDELTVVNSTISGNVAEGDPPVSSLSEQYNDGEGFGGGIDNDGDSSEDGGFEGPLAAESIPAEAPYLRAENSTIAFNEAEANGGGVATAVSSGDCNEARGATACATGEPQAIARFHNTIVSDNDQDGTSNCFGNQAPGSGAFTSSEGHNLEEGDSCLFAADGDLDKASGLSALADNGGGTNTHALEAGSAALNAAESDGCPSVDQRSTFRPQGAACDIGAFERVVETAPQQQSETPLPQPQRPEEPRGPRCLDTVPPLTTLNRDGLRVTDNTVTLKGTSRDLEEPCISGVQRVEVSLARVSGTDLNCRFLRRSSRFLLSPFMNCRESIRFVAQGTNRWTFRFNVKLPPGRYRVQARGYDEERNKETPKKRRNIVPFTVK